MSSAQPKPTWPADPGCELGQRDFDGTAFRVGRSPDPWAWTPHDFIGNGRWDDPERTYRVMYTSDQRRGAVLEKLVWLARDIEATNGVAGIGGPRRFMTNPSGVIPRQSLRILLLGKAVLEGAFADLATDDSVHCLRDILNDQVDAAAIGSVDPRVFWNTEDTPITQMISRFIYEHSTDGDRTYAGIRSKSAQDEDVRNWNLYEGGRIIPSSSEPIDPQDRDVASAAASLGIQFIN